MKRAAAAMMAAVVAGTCMCGCTAGKNSVKEGETPTLSWYIPVSSQKDAPMVEEKLNEIIEPEIGAKLKFNYIASGVFQERLSMMMASEDEFDITFSGYCNPYTKAVQLGGFAELTEYINNAPALKEAIPDYAWQAVKTNKGIYAVPNLQIYVNWMCPMLRKEYVEKYNFDTKAVKHIEDIEPFMEDIKNNEPDLYPYEAAYGIGYWTDIDAEKVSSDIGLLYIKLDDPQCKVYKVYETPEWRKGIETLRKWYEKGYIRKDVASASGIGGSSKKYAIMHAVNKPGYETLFKNSHNGEEIVVVDLGIPILNTSSSLATLNSVGANSKHKELAVELLEQVNVNKDVHRLITHGIEGVHYDKVDDIHIKTKNSEGYNMSGLGWMTGNDFNSYLLEGQDDDTWEKTAELNETAVKSPLFGFTLDTSSIINEMSIITSVNSEFGGLFNGTAENIDECINKYITKLEEAGIDKVQKEMQRQIDMFLANK